MSHLKVILLISLSCFNAIVSVKSENNCEHIANKQFICYDTLSLQVLDKASRNVSIIKITESKLFSIPGYTFSRFGPTLLSLDLHNSHINSVEPNGFAGLEALRELKLWGNDLIWVSANWFSFLPNLRHLDLSFNKITGIDYNIFYNFYNLDTLYIDNNRLMTIDYNLFQLMPMLRNVQIGNNPWQWIYRVQLQWQLDNQRIVNNEIWDNWDWISDSIKTCKTEGHDLLNGSDMLYCAFHNLLDFQFTQINTSNPNQIESQPAYGDYISKAFKVTQCIKHYLRMETPEVIMTTLKALLSKLMLMDQSQNFHIKFT